MAILKLEIKNLRNLTDVIIQPKPGLNYILGPNGSGKTSLLEAIHCLGRGKSFRSHKTNHLINNQSSEFSIVGKIQQKGRPFIIGMRRTATNTQIRLGGQSINRASELTNILPLAVLDPGLHRLVEEGPDQRRRFLDWGVFHVEHSFSGLWNNYRHCLAQRNAALRTGWSQKAIVHWDKELALVAEQLDQARRDYLANLLVYIEEYIIHFPAICKISITYQQGWRESTDYFSYLTAQYQSDKDRGFTQFGPHRADLRLKIDGMDARDYLSRGQQKVLVASMILAQCRQITAQGTSAVILVDDLHAEVDAEIRGTLLALLESTKAQVFLTGTDPSFFPIDHKSSGVFHVEHGRVRI